MEITLKVKQTNEITGLIETIGTKIVYSSDGNGANDWARTESKSEKIDFPTLSSSISVKQKKGKMPTGSIGSIFSAGNAVYYNTQFVSLFSSSFTSAGWFSIDPSNFLKVVALFTARKTIVPNWINCKDEYLIPNISHPDYSLWNSDAIVYSLFNNSSQQSSLRDVDYKGKIWQIQNQFFFMSNAEMKLLADTHKFNEMFQDAKTYPDDAYVYNLLKTITLSADAQEVLNHAIRLVKQGMKYRPLYHLDHPEYNLHSWNAGWAQLKVLLKTYMKNELSEFRNRYNEFGKRMKEGVYKFGFLK